jgi:hypothetical protein
VDGDGPKRVDTTGLEISFAKRAESGAVFVCQQLKGGDPVSHCLVASIALTWIAGAKTSA